MTFLDQFHFFIQSLFDFFEILGQDSYNISLNIGRLISENKRCYSFLQSTRVFNFGVQNRQDCKTNIECRHSIQTLFLFFRALFQSTVKK